MTAEVPLEDLPSVVDITYGPQIAIVGAGPRGTSILERITASATQFITKNSWLTIHIIDPFPPGAGKVWRTDQSRLLLMNLISSQVTLFTDDTVECDGPIIKGPTLHEWLLRNGYRLGPNEFSTRVQCGSYLRWVFDSVLEKLPGNVRVKLHVAEARELNRDPKDPDLYELKLSTGKLENLSAVILAQGHLGAKLTQEEAGLKQHADRNPEKLTYVGPGNAADASLSHLNKLNNVLLRGLGLSYFDYLTLLSEGLGGEYVRENCELKYKRSGREPLIYSFSRRGLPLHGRGYNELAANDRYKPAKITTDIIDDFRQRADNNDAPDFETELWPLIAFEVEAVYYRQVLRARDVPTTKFEKKFLDAKNDTERNDVLKDFGLDGEDRWDWKKVKNPHSDTPFATTKDHLGKGGQKWQEWMANYLREDVRQAQLGTVHGPHAAARSVLRDIRGEIRQIVDHKGIKDNQVEDGRYYLRDKFSPLNSFLAVGPPIERIEQMIALIEADVLHILEPDSKIEPLENGSGWIINNRVKVQAFIEARVQKPTVLQTTDPLLEYLRDNKTCRSHHNGSYDTDGLDTTIKPYRVVDGSGQANQRLFAIGVPTEGLRWATTALPRPYSNADAFLTTDAVARAALRQAQRDLIDGKVKLDLENAGMPAKQT